MKGRLYRGTWKEERVNMMDTVSITEYVRIMMEDF
jgi:hypothetical protein